MKLDPNKAFQKYKHPYASPRPQQKLLLLRCDAKNCGYQMKVTREWWISDEEIMCPQCLSTDYWGLL